MVRVNNLIVPDDYLKEVWWAEGTKEHHEVRYGYLLAQYRMGSELCYIVTLGNINTTVIRHLKKYYYTEKDAYASIVDLPSQIH